MSRKRVVAQDEKSISHPAEENTKVQTTGELAMEIAYLRERLDAVTKIQTVLLLSGASPTLDGHKLARCRCGKFATRLFSIYHPMVGDNRQYLCDGCKVEHPVAHNHLSKIEEISYGTSGVVKFARDLNLQIATVLK